MRALSADEGVQPLIRSRFGLTWGSAASRLGIAVLAIIVIAPVVFIVYGAFLTGYPAAPATHVTTEWWSAVYGSSAYLPSLAWSLGIAFVTASLATLIGAAFAWTFQRVEVPFRALAEGVLLAAFALPPVLSTIAWVALLAPRAGFLNVLYGDLLHTDLLNIASSLGIVMVMTFVFTPLAFLLASGGFASADFTEEEAARVHGASLWRTIRSVTIPSVRLSMAVCWILVFTISAQTFAVVLLLGAAANIQTVPELMYQGVVNGQMPVGEVAMLGTLLIWPAALGLAGLLIYDRRSASRGVRISGSPGHWRLGRARAVVLSLGSVYLLVATVLPMLALIAGSFFKYQTSHFSASLLTLANFTGTFANAQAMGYLLNTAVLSVGAATVGLGAAFLVAYLERYDRSSWLRTVVHLVTTLPLVMPRLVLALGFLLALDTVPFLRGWSGSLVVMGATIVIANLGLGTRTLGAHLARLPASLDEAGRMCGASTLPRMYRITLPSIAPSLLAVWRTYFVLTVLEVDLLIFLYQPDTTTLSIATLLGMAEGVGNTVYPLAVLQVILVAVAIGGSAFVGAILKRRYSGGKP